MKTKLINKLLYKYNFLLKEITAQKDLFYTQHEYIKTLTKLQSYINLVHGIQLRELTIYTIK